MPEQKSDRKITRRQFLFGMGAAGVTLSAGTTLQAAGELLSLPDVLHTEHAEFILIPEAHHEESKKIPQVQMLFREYAGDDLSTKNSNELLRMTIEVPELSGRVSEVRLFSDDNIATLEQQGISVLFGDIVIPPGVKNDVAMRNAIKTAFGIGTLVEGARTISDLSNIIHPGDPDQLEKEQLQMDRRSALKTIGIIVSSLTSRVLGVGAALGGVAAFGKEIPLLTRSRIVNNPLGKLLNELQGVYSYIERSPDVLLRDALIAHKLLTYAESMHASTGVRPKIGIQMGMNHVGIRYLLDHGLEACEGVLDWFPKETYRGIFYTAEGEPRLIQKEHASQFLSVDPKSAATTEFEDTRLRDYLQRRLQG